MRFDRQVLCHLLWLLPVAFWPGSNSYDGVKFTLLAVAASLWLGHAGWQKWHGRPSLQLDKRWFGVWTGLIFLLGIETFTASNPALVWRTGLLISLFALVTHQTAKQTGGLPKQLPLLAAATLGAALAGTYGLLQIADLVPGAPTSSGYPPGISTRSARGMRFSITSEARR